VRSAGSTGLQPRLRGRSDIWHVKKMLLSLIVVGGLGCFTVTGTFALLNSETQNNRGKISSGTLTFSNKVNTGTACYSYGAGTTGNVNSSCTALFQNTTLMYPGVPVTQKVTIANDGSIDGRDLSVYMPSCTMVTSPGAPTPGGGNPCAGGAQIYIQETDSSFITTPSCVFPTTGGTCLFATDTLAYLASVANTATSAVSLGSGPTHGAFRYFVIGMQLPSNASNALQGEEALFTLTWRLST
jgi:hypothetical protein